MKARGEEHYSQKKVPDKPISIVPGPPTFGMPHLGAMMTRDGACGEVPLNPEISVGTSHSLVLLLPILTWVKHWHLYVIEDTFLVVYCPPDGSLVSQAYS
jgi:hypothetical protein